MRWFDAGCNRAYETPQAYVDEAIRFDDVREGGQFTLRDLETDDLVRFKVERGKAAQLPG
jgi:hypothetical protein